MPFDLLTYELAKNAGGGGGGTYDYNELGNQPKINGQTLVGNKTSADLGIQDKLTAGANVSIQNNTISATDTVYDDTELRTGKLNKLPNVDDPTDPGFGYAYHIPYDVAVAADADKINLTLKTITLDNNLIKMNFNKSLPGATTTTAGLMTSSDKTNLANKQDKLTAGANITIDENNVISATGGGTSVVFDEKTIVKGADNKYKTAIDGWKEITPEPVTNLFVDTKGNGSPTYINTDKYEVGWDYNATITSLVSGATTATIKTKFTVLGTIFNSNVALTKSQSIPATWESAELTIGGNVYKIKVYDQYLGENQGGIGLIANDHTLDLSDATMESCGLVTGSSSVIYHPIDSKFINIDNETIKLNSDNKLYANVSSAQYIELTFYTDGQTGTLTDEQVQILLASELNYIWLNGMHRLDFKYRDDNNNKATYSAVDTSSDGNKTHSVEINLTTKAFTVYHRTLQEKLTAGSNITISNNVISATGGSSTLQAELTTNIAVGGIPAGTTFAVGTSLESILRQLLYQEPVGTTYYYTGIVNEIPTSVTGLQSHIADKSTLLMNGTVVEVTTNNQYAVLAIDKAIGLKVKKIIVSGFEMEFNEADLGEQYLYYFDDPTFESAIEYTYTYKEAQ